MMASKNYRGLVYKIAQKNQNKKVLEFYVLSLLIGLKKKMYRTGKRGQSARAHEDSLK